MPDAVLNSMNTTISAMKMASPFSHHGEGSSGAYGASAPAMVMGGRAGPCF